MIWRFHPTLVLAQQVLGMATCKVHLFPSHIGSRSTKSAGYGYMLSPSVSIPHWFSLNKYSGYVYSEWYYVFPSHIGSRSTEGEEPEDQSSWLFPSHIGPRSTATRIRIACHVRYVSIPHWFSLNEKIEALRSVYGKFPSHIGSRSTLRGNWNLEEISNVSIPHWFSLNCYITLFFCIFLYVSIPHWFSLNPF